MTIEEIIEELTCAINNLAEKIPSSPVAGPPKKRAPRKKDKPKEEDPEVEPKEEDPEVEPKEEAPEKVTIELLRGAEEATIEDLREAGTAVIEAGKKDEFIALLNDTFKVPNIMKLEESQYAECLAELKKLL